MVPAPAAAGVMMSRWVETASGRLGVASGTFHYGGLHGFVQPGEVQLAVSPSHLLLFGISTRSLSCLEPNPG